MVANIGQIIGKINPLKYAENGISLLKKYKKAELIPAEEVVEKPAAQQKLVYDSSSETLEPIYFFIIDLLNDLGLAPEKLIDNFTTSAGSGHFSELGQRATIMQQQGTKMLADINTVLKSVLNVLYDLRDFKTRLQQYEDLKDPLKKEGARLALKQIWLDKVDLALRGQGSIHAMSSGNLQYVTLRDAFLAVNDAKDVNNLDLNDRVKRVLTPRIQEFNAWVEQSYQELKRRYEIERNYLKSQVNAIKLYSRWVRPYLKAAFQLEMKDQGRSPDLVKTFNTIILELALLGKTKLKVKESAQSGDLPLDFAKEAFLRSLKKEYFSCVLVEFRFRGIPQRVTQQSHYVFGGRAEITFKAYSLNNEEIAMLNQELNESDLGDVLRLIEGTTTESLGQIQEEINYFIEERDKKEAESQRKDTSNPFLALFGFYNKSEAPKKEVKKEENKKIVLKPENWIEKNHLRKLSEEKAVKTIFDLFDIYKKAHGMASYT